MMTPLVLVGAGGFGRETAELVRALNHVSPRFDLLGFVDDAEAFTGEQRVGLPILGTTDWLHDHDAVSVVVCVGRPSAIDLRRRVVERLGLDAGRFATLVHPAAIMPSSVSVGCGTVIHATCVCTADVRIGRHVQMMPGVVLTHDDDVDDFVTLGAGARLAGSVTVRAGAYIGSAASVRENLNIGRDSMVGMGSVVTVPVPTGEIWVGNPARRLRKVIQPTSSRSECVA